MNLNISPSFKSLLRIALITILIPFGQLNAQCPPAINAGVGATILCGASVDIGAIPPTVTPGLAPACSDATQLTQAGGSYINSITTTGGITNITNTNTLVDGGNPSSSFVAISRWYSNYTSQVVETNAGSTFNVIIQGAAVTSLPTYYRIWIDWNNDGLFNNTNELVWTSTQGYNHTATISVPAGQVSGVFRMRIRSKQNCPFVPSDMACTFNNPIGTNCANGGYSPGSAGPYWFADEIEDYSVKIGGTTAGSNTGNNTYLWTPSTGLSATNIPNPTASPTQTTTYTLTVTDPVNNCSATQQVTVTVAGVVDFTYTVGACQNDLYDITGTITTPLAPTTGTLIAKDCNGNLTTIATAPFAGTTFPFTLTGQTADGTNCSLEIYFSAATCPKIVSFTAPAPCTGCITPFVYISNSTNENCDNDDGTITLNITSGGVAPFTYSIDNGTTTQATGSFTGLSAGVYNVIIKDDQGCVEIEQITLTNTSSQNSTFNFSDFCEGTTNQPNGIGTTGGTFSFNPVVTDGATINATTGSISNGVGGTTYTVQYLLSGACPSSSTEQVTVNATPETDFLVNKITGCEPLEVNFSSNLNLGGASCLWEFGDGNTSTDCNNVTHTFTNSGSYNITLTITSSQGCSLSHTENNLIQVYTAPKASFTANPFNPNIMNPVVKFTNSSTNSTDYKWVFGDNSAPGYNVNPTHTYPSDVEGNYEVTLYAYNGSECMDSITQIIQVEEELVFYVPNAFTPDGDEFNPIFKPVFTSGFDPQYYDLLVFDRWGELLFESHDTDFGWDGTYLGERVSDNSYIWKINIKEKKSDKKLTFNGHVTLIR